MNIVISVFSDISVSSISRTLESRLGPKLINALNTTLRMVPMKVAKLIDDVINIL